MQRLQSQQSSETWLMDLPAAFSNLSAWTLAPNCCLARAEKRALRLTRITTTRKPLHLRNGSYALQAPPIAMQRGFEPCGQRQSQAQPPTRTVRLAGFKEKHAWPLNLQSEVKQLVSLSQLHKAYQNAWLSWFAFTTHETRWERPTCENSTTAHFCPKAEEQYSL